MNLHGSWRVSGIHYGSPGGGVHQRLFRRRRLSRDPGLGTSLAQEHGQLRRISDKSKYADGTFFDKMSSRDWLPTLPESPACSRARGCPSREDWAVLGRPRARRITATCRRGAADRLGSATSTTRPPRSIRSWRKIEIRKGYARSAAHYPAASRTKSTTSTTIATPTRSGREDHRHLRRMTGYTS